MQRIQLLEECLKLLENPIRNIERDESGPSWVSITTAAQVDDVGQNLARQDQTRTPKVWIPNPSLEKDKQIVDNQDEGDKSRDMILDFTQDVPGSYRRRYDGESNRSPFSDEIANAPYPKGFDLRDLPKYDGSRNMMEVKIHKCILTRLM